MGRGFFRGWSSDGLHRDRASALRRAGEMVVGAGVDRTQTGQRKSGSRGQRLNGGGGGTAGAGVVGHGSSIGIRGREVKGLRGDFLEIARPAHTLRLSLAPYGSASLRGGQQAGRQAGRRSRLCLCVCEFARATLGLLWGGCANVCSLRIPWGVPPRPPPLRRPPTCTVGAPTTCRKTPPV